MARTKALGDIADFRLGISASEDATGTIPMIRVGDLNGPISWAAVGFTTAYNAADNRFALAHGDVLIARSGEGSVGNLAVVLDPPSPSTFASYVIRVRPIAGWDGRFIAYWLKTHQGTAELEARIVGTPIRNLSSERLRSLPVPEVDQEVQERVGRATHSAYQVFSETRARLTSAMSALSAVNRLHGPLASAIWEEDYPRLALSELTENVDRHRVPLNSSQRELRAGGVPYYGASGVIDFVSGHTHEGNHLLVSEDGNNLRTRRTPIAFVAYGKFWANNHVHVLLPDETRVLGEFLAMALDSLNLQPFLTGSTQPKLNQRALSSLAIPMPTLEKQREILHLASEIDGRLSDLRQLGTTALQNLNSAWMEFLEITYANDGGGAHRELTLDEADRWLSLIEEQGILSMDSASDSTDRLHTTDARTNGLMPIEVLFEQRSAMTDAEEVEEEIDQFFAWLREETRAGRVTLVTLGDRTLIRITE